MEDELIVFIYLFSAVLNKGIKLFTDSEILEELVISAFLLISTHFPSARVRLKTYEQLSHDFPPSLKA